MAVGNLLFGQNVLIYFGILLAGLVGCSSEPEQASTGNADASVDMLASALDGQVQQEDCPASCYRGLIYADCDHSSSEPTLNCKSSDPNTCVWLTADCELPDYPVRDTELSRADAGAIGWYSRYWGITPWGRETSMNLSVVQQQIEQDGAVVSCDCDLEQLPATWGSQCAGPNGICGNGGSENAVHMTFRENWTQGNGTISWSFSPTMASVGFFFVVEVDLERRRASACLIGQEDSYAERPEPQCASDGTVYLNHFPNSDAQAKDLGIEFSADFGSVTFSSGRDPFIDSLTVSGHVSGSEATIVRVPSP